MPGTRRPLRPSARRCSDRRSSGAASRVRRRRRRRRVPLNLVARHARARLLLARLHRDALDASLAQLVGLVLRVDLVDEHALEPARAAHLERVVLAAARVARELRRHLALQIACLRVLHCCPLVNLTRPRPSVFSPSSEKYSFSPTIRLSTTGTPMISPAEWMRCHSRRSSSLGVASPVG